jgi:hypothetical protein
MSFTTGCCPRTFFMNKLCHKDLKKNKEQRRPIFFPLLSEATSMRMEHRPLSVSATPFVAKRVQVYLVGCRRYFCRLLEVKSSLPPRLGRVWKRKGTNLVRHEVRLRKIINSRGCRIGQSTNLFWFSCSRKEQTTSNHCMLLSPSSCASCELVTDIRTSRQRSGPK